MDRRGVAGFVHGHENDLGLRDLDALALAAAPALGLHRNPHRDRGAAHADRLREEVHDVAEEDGLVELHLTHGLGDVAPGRGLAGFHGRREIDVGEDHAAEDGAEDVRVLGQEQDLDRGNPLVAHR